VKANYILYERKLPDKGRGQNNKKR